MDLTRWMENLPRHMTERSLIELAIPGTHDSFTYSLDPTSEIAPDEPRLLQLLGSLCMCPVDKITYDWSVTQKLNLYEQLEAGIRYFDFRVSSRAHSTDLFIVHGLYGETIERELRMINKFLEVNRKEVVLLDFNHFYVMSDDHHKKLISSIFDVFGQKLCLYEGIEKLTLDMMWSKGQQVVVFYQDKVHEGSLWPSCSIKSPWPNTPNPQKVIKYLNRNYQQDRGNCFYVCQGVATPSVKYICLHLCGNLKSKLADRVMPKLLTWLRNKPAGSKGVNICIADFVDSDFAKSVVNLNFCKNDLSSTNCEQWDNETVDRKVL